MALRDSMRTSTQPFLAPGEQVQQVFGAQTASNYLIILGLLPFFLVNRYRIIAVTQQRILVLDSGWFSMKKANSVVTELPRSTRLGPGSGVWHLMPLGNEKLRVHRRFFKDIQAADTMAASA